MFQVWDCDFEDLMAVFNTLAEARAYADSQDFPCEVVKVAN